MVGMSDKGEGLDELLDEALNDFGTTEVKLDSGVDGGEGDKASNLGADGQSITENQELNRIFEEFMENVFKNSELDKNASSPLFGPSEGDTNETFSRLFKMVGLDFGSSEQLSNNNNNNSENFVEDLVESLLSKDIIHEPMKTLAKFYPEWLASNEPTSTSTESERQKYEIHKKQYECVKQIVHIFENEGDSKEVFELINTMNSISDLPEELIEKITKNFDHDQSSVD